MFSNMRQRVNGEQKQRYAGLELLSRSDFVALALNNPTFNLVFEQWHESGCIYKLTPSVDRIDSTGGYTQENIRFVTQSENSSRGAIEMWQARKAASGTLGTQGDANTAACPERTMAEVASPASTSSASTQTVLEEHQTDDSPRE
jgi:hypothetical protein